MNNAKLEEDGIAIVGMAARFPGANTVEAFWKKLTDGADMLCHYSDEELRRAGVEDRLLNNPNFVKTNSLLPDFDCFDADFFKFSPMEAEVTDPQQRIFLELAWHALENAGHDPETFKGMISVFAGMSTSAYFYRWAQQADEAALGGLFRVHLGNDKDTLATWTSYKLNLTGPSFTLQSACSTSLAAIHLACQNLLNGESDMALAGGVTVTNYGPSGYIYQDGGITSPDGYCRSFAAEAKGTVSGNGAGIVVLKRLEEAIDDGNTIYAVIRGSAMNNDGSRKIGYTAPSIQGQSEVIRDALSAAEVEPESISYVEAHGTATPLGDPIEVAALTEAFDTDEKQFCGLGSVKSNMGHMDAAAGVAGLMKIALALYHKQLPASLHFDEANPKIDFANTPFYVNNQSKPWESEGVRRAGVSSFGMGGTNVHAVLEEAPQIEQEPEEERPADVLVLSAQTKEALRTQMHNLADHLQNHPAVVLEDAATTLRHGRQALKYRCSVACATRESAIEALKHPGATLTESPANPNEVVFMFPGQGAQHAGMAAQLYEHEPFFYKTVNKCLDLIEDKLPEDLGTLMFEDPDGDKKLKNTALAQPALFIVEYALAKLWISWGIRPKALIGHSLGEYTAACLAGVLSLEDALDLVIARGRLMADLPTGKMLAVSMDEKDLKPLLGSALSLAAVNGAKNLVASGPAADIETLAAKLAEKKIPARELHTSHAFHSAMMNPILEHFEKALGEVILRQPKIPYISCKTGTWITPTQAIDPKYWSTQLRGTIQFYKGLNTLKEKGAYTFLEVGPREGLTQLAHRAGISPVLSSQPTKMEEGWRHIMQTTGALWCAGYPIKWGKVDRQRDFKRIPLPAYPFARNRYMVKEAPRPAQSTTPPLQAEPAVAVAQAPAPVKPPPTIMTVTPSTGRKERLIDKLQNLLEETFGFARENMDIHKTFYELGVDSLLMIQAGNAIKETFQIDFSHRVMFEEHPTLDAFATFLDENLPQEALTETPAPAPQPEKAPVAQPFSGTTTTTAPPNGLQALFDRQLQIMEDQLAILKTHNTGGMPTLPQATAAPSPAPKSVKIMQEAGDGKSKAVLPFKPAKALGREDLSTAQKAFLDELCTRFNEKTKESKRQTQMHRLAHADARTAAGFKPEFKEMSYRIMSANSQGGRIWDVDGNCYVDITLGFGVHLFGHRAPFLLKAMEDRMKIGLALGAQSELAGDCANLIRELTGVERVAFSNTGTEAIMCAMRIARAVTHRKKIVSFLGSYHGTFDGVLTRPKMGTSGGEAMPLVLGTAPGMIEDMILLDYGDPKSLETIKALGNELAAVIVEPVQSRRPDYMPVEFLQQIREITRETGTCFIFDEVVTGFRSHPGGVMALAGVQADLVVYGKVLGGGMPLGVVGGTSQFMDAVDGGMWSFGDDSMPYADQTLFAGTFCKHPLTLATTMAVLQHLKREGPALQDRLADKAAALCKDIEASFHREGIQLKTVRFRSQFRLRFPPEQRFAELIEQFLVCHGVYGWEGGNYFLSTAHTEEDLDLVRAAFANVARDMGTLNRLGASSDGDQGRDLLDTGTALSKSYDLTRAQKEMWVACQMGDDAARAYNQTAFLTFMGKDGTSHLANAIQQVVNRHEALRSTFSAAGSKQSFRAQLIIDIPKVDLKNVVDTEVAVREWGAQQGAEVFDLEKDALLRAAILEVAPDRCIMVLTIHHIIIDGFSSGLVCREIRQVYNALQEGTSPSLNKPTQFSDYLDRLARNENAAAFTKAETYWKKVFKKPAPALQLPTDNPRPVSQSFLGKKLSLTLSNELTQELREKSQEQGSTLFNTLLASFKILLHRLTGQNDLIVAVPISGQILTGQTTMVGYCQHMLPLRSLYVDNNTFTQKLTKVKNAMMDAFQHYLVDMEHLYEMLGVTRTPDRPPLAGIYFNLDNMAGSDAPENALKVIDCYSKVDLDLNIIEWRENITLEWLYNTDLFAEETMWAWMQHFETLLTNLIRQPESPLGGINLLSEAQQQTVLHGFQRKAPDYVQTFSAAIATAAAKAPKATAVIQGEHSLTFGDLDRRANHLARTLQKAGLKTGDRVGICLHPGVDWMVAMLGILKAGGVYVIFNTKHEARQVSRARCARLVVSSAEENHAAWSHMTKVAQIIDLKSGGVLSDAPVLTVDPTVPAYALFNDEKNLTVATHGRIISTYTGLQSFIGRLSQPATVAVTTGPGTPAFQNALTLLAGGNNLILSFGDDAHLANVPVTVLFCTSMQLVNRIKAGNLEKAGFQHVLLHGEPVHQALWQRLSAQNTPQFAYAYSGPEQMAFTLADITRETSAHLGKPLANNRFYLLDKLGVPTPYGVPGEVCVSSSETAPDADNHYGSAISPWREDPFARTEGFHLYRTGDHARLLPDGRFDFMGRSEDKVSVAGEWIALRDIEKVLRNHDHVLEAQALLWEDGVNKPRLIAWVLPQGDTWSSEALLSHMKARLPVAGIPAEFIALKHLPLTADGAVHHDALPSPSHNTMVDQEGYVAPRNKAERQLAAIWKEVLKVDVVGIRDNFYSLAGDSIKAISVCARAKRMGYPVTARMLQQNQTVEDLVVALGHTVVPEIKVDIVVDTLPQVMPLFPNKGDMSRISTQDMQSFQWNDSHQQAIVESLAEAGIDQTWVEDVYPLSPLQEGLLFHSLEAPDKGVYVNRVALQLKGRFDQVAFQQSLQEIMARYPVLRTGFLFGGDLQKPIQVVGSTAEAPIETLTWEKASLDQQLERLERFLDEDARRGFKLEQAPLMRVTLIEIDTDHRFMVWSFHHIILDGWCLRRVFGETVYTYRAKTMGQEMNLPSSRPFRHYIDWLHNQDQAEAETYWKHAVQGFSEPTSLGFERDIETTEEHGSHIVTATLGKEQTAQLQAFARQNRLTPNTIFQGLWALCLSCYSGRNDVLFGAVTSGRPPELEDVETMVGFFMNMLPVRVKVPGHLPLADWLLKLQDDQFEARRFEHMSLMKIKEWSGIPGDGSLFNSILAFQNLDSVAGGVQTAGDQHDLSIEEIPVPDISHYPLLLKVFPGETVTVEAHCDNHRFDLESGNQIVGHLVGLLNQFLANPKQPLSAFSLLSAEQRNEILNDWNQTQADYPKDKCFHQLFAQQAAKTPDAVALVYAEPGAPPSDQQKMTYAQLKEQSDQLAARLRAAGVGPDVFVGLCMSRSIEMVVGLMAIMTANGAYMPMDPAYPLERLNYMAQDSGIKVLLTDKANQSCISTEGLDVILLDEPFTALDPGIDVIPLPPTSTSQPVYMIYTSGSTGKPKGAVITHRGLINYLSWCTQAYAVADGHGALVHGSIGFDATVTAIWSPLVTGRTVAMVPQDHEIDGLVDTMCSYEQYSLAKITPAHLTPLAESVSFEERPVQVKAMVLGGEALLGRHLTYWAENAPDTKIFNEYGPTETVVGCCVYEVPADRYIEGPVPIGKPIANTQLYILDPYLQPVPVGIPGELYIGGDGLARGYYNRPDLTADRFIPNPFTQENGRRLYRTGDKVRYLPGGDIEFLGRIDNQISLHGYRIEPGEIETAIDRHEAVKASVVMVRKDDDTPRLVAYVTLEDSPTSESEITAKLRDDLHAWLPEYMVPSVFVPLQVFPLTTNGKVDRAALPEVDATGFATTTCFTAPRNPLEETLVGIWAKVLHKNKDQVGVFDNFFELGGNSINAILISGQVRRAGYTMMPNHLFEAPTIAKLAEMLEQIDGTEITLLKGGDDPEALKKLFFPDTDELGRIETALKADEEQIEAFYPIAPLQEGMLFQSLLNPNRGAYVNRVAVKITGNLDDAALEQAFNQVSDHFQVLRVQFLWEDLEKPVQAAFKSKQVPFERLSWQDTAPEDMDARWQAYVKEENIKGLALNQAPLMRITLIQTAERSWLMSWVYHHIILDGWSLPIVFDAVFTAYRANLRGEAPQLPPSQPYQTYVQWLYSQDKGKAETYWKESLAGFDEPSIIDVKKPANATNESFVIKSVLSAEDTTRLKTFASGNQLTENTLVQAAWALLLSRYSGKEDVVFGVTTSGRPADLDNVDNMVGLFINTLPFRTIIPTEGTLVDWLKQIQKGQLEARRFEYSPLIDIQGWSEIPRGLPFFDNVLAFENFPLAPPDADKPANAESTVSQDAGTLSFEMIETPIGTGNPLTLLVVPGDEMSLVLDGDGSGLDRDSAVRVAGHLKNLLTEFLNHPNQAVRKLPMLTVAERDQMLLMFNNTQVARPTSRFPQWFEEQAAKTPSAIAVELQTNLTAAVAGEKEPVVISWTYDQLNCRANQLAAYLQSRGVGPETAVAVFMDRCPEALAATLGILKAGGAFMPLPPDLPGDRLNFILDDSGVDIMLTTPAAKQKLPNCNANVIEVDGDWTCFASQPKDNPVNNSPANAMAYIIYTSGSTGKPKGTFVSSQSMENLLLWYNTYFSIETGTRVLQVFSLGFDSSVKNMLAPLIAGATTVLFPSGPFDPYNLVTTIQSRNIQLLNCVPSMVYPLLEVAAEDDYKALESLRYLAVIGEVLNVAKVRAWLAAPNCSCTLANTYGPTEAADNNLAYLFPPEDIQGTETTMPLGTPVENVRIYVVGPNLELVPPGAAGELLLGDICVARGYLKRPALTAEKFIPDPFAPERQPGARLYRTGDVVRYMPDQNLVYFVGRADAQVKIRGNRVELGEIEHALKAMEPVKDAVVLAPMGRDGNKTLVAYIEPREQDDELDTKLRNKLGEDLPRYMVPETIIFLESFPKLPNGKLNRKALPDPEAGRATSQAAYEAPQSETEQKIAGFWQEILHLEKVSRNANFFDIGGHSLHMVQLHVKLKRAFDTDLTMIELFGLPTIQAIAEHILGRKDNEASLQDAQARASKQKAARARKKKKAAKGKVSHG